ncbi:cytochrome P450 [Bombardia bombarda]|uniref:Cytochrome P450 n=1 Tax=Bombardia bombarda TaxID=252184 RepID=A0AA40C9W5_9PEZI|nr:cytochrome P450 [Bombardia bombarda]
MPVIDSSHCSSTPSIPLFDICVYHAPKEHLAFSAIAIVFVLCLSLKLFAPKKSQQTRRIPVFGYRSAFEPTLSLTSRFVVNARKMVTEGCSKFRDTPFLLRRFDSDVMVLPKKYLNELRLAPASQLNSARALSGSKVYKWTFSSPIVESDIHQRVLGKKLVSEASKYLDLAKTELEYGWSTDIPITDATDRTLEWKEVDISHSVRTLVARMTSKVMLGSIPCRNEEWINMTTDFPVRMFTTRVLLSLFPAWSLPVMSQFIPSRYRLKQHFKTAERIIGPLMKSHIEAVQRRSTGAHVEEEDTLLHSMMDAATGKENEIAEMAARQCLIAFAGVNTTSNTIANVLFDLAAHREWISILLKEIDGTTAELGKMNEQEGAGLKHWLGKLEKLDSFIMESMRINPVMLLTSARYATQPQTMKDGFHIPGGTTVAWPNYFYHHDPSTVAEPDVFDPMRSHRKRHASSEQMTKHTVGRIDVNNLAFGYGKQACPGRMLAAGQIKATVVKFLSEFEFRYPEGKTRPTVCGLNEFSFPDLEAKLLVRLRR